MTLGGATAERPLTIGIDGTALYGRYGGVEYALWNLLDALRAGEATRPATARHRFVVWVPRNGPLPASLKRFDARWRWVRLSFAGEEKLRRIAWQQLELPLALRRARCDLLHAPTYVCPLLAPLPVVLTVYDLIALHQPAFATRTNRLHYGAVMPLSIRRARRVIAPSEPVARQITGHGWQPASRVRVVAPGVEPLFFASHAPTDLAALRARYDLPQHYILWAGNFEPKKNGVVLRRALQLLPRHGVSHPPTLVVAGGARAWREHDFGAQAPDGASGGIQTLGYVRRSELPLLLAGCRAFAFPSRAEGFGMPALEALASGAPLVASTRVPLPSLDQVALLSEPDDADALAANLARVLLDPQLAAELSEKGRAYARDFTWSRAAQETRAVYAEAVVCGSRRWLD